MMLRPPPPLRARQREIDGAHDFPSVLQFGEPERRAWATVKKETGGGKKIGRGRGKRHHARVVSSTVRCLHCSVPQRVLPQPRRLLPRASVSLLTNDRLQRPNDLPLVSS